jgi:protein ImuB
MRLSEATALVDVEVREHDLHDDIDALCTLAEAAQQFSPIVGLEQLDKQMWAGRYLRQPECLLLDVTGLASLFGGEAKLVKRIMRWLAQQNFFGCIGLAGSLGAAWAVANFALRGGEQPRSSAGLHSQPAGNSNSRSLPPAGEGSNAPPQADDTEAEATYTAPVCRSLIVPDGEDEQRLDILPLAALRLPAETVESLRRLGIRSIGQLESLPRDGVATRLGDDLIARWDQAYGRKSEAIITLHGQPQWCLEHLLEYPTQQFEITLEVVHRLTRELSSRLAKQGAGALRLVCRLDLVQNQPLVMQLGLFRPTNDAAHLEQLLTGQFEQQMRVIKLSSIWRISLQATLTAPMIWRQTGLFDGEEAASRSHMARLVDTLSSRLGRKQVLCAAVKREAQPELAVTFQPLTGRRQDGSETSTIKKLSSRIARRRAEPSRDDPLRRPTLLFPKPIPIDVRLKESKSGLTKAPVEFQYQGTWQSVTEARGPERLESGWWRGPSARRDYYRVTTARGSWWWLYRDLTTGDWFIHGLYD